MKTEEATRDNAWDNAVKDWRTSDWYNDFRLKMAHVCVVALAFGFFMNTAYASYYGHDVNWWGVVAFHAVLAGVPVRCGRISNAGLTASATGRAAASMTLTA